MKRWFAIALGIVSLGTASVAKAEPPLKVGLLYTYSGPSGSMGEEIDNGVKAFLRLNGDLVAGRKVEIIRKDIGGPKPDVARRLAQEMIVQDHVDFITGIDYTPNAVGIGRISTESKTPAVIMNASGSGALKGAPYMVRVSCTNQQISSPMAVWALKNGIKTSFIAVADYAPGLEAAQAFSQVFTAGGGSIVGEVHVPTASIDFSAEMQRIKDSKAAAVFAFFPPLPQAPIFLNQFREAGLSQAGVQVLASGEMTDDFLLGSAIGDVAIGVITTHNYTYLHDSTLNKAFVKAFEMITEGRVRPNQMSVGAFDGLHIIYMAVEAQQGHLDPEKTLAYWKGLSVESPRGMIKIDPENRSVIQDVSIRRVEKVDGLLQNREIDRIVAVPPTGVSD